VAAHVSTPWNEEVLAKLSRMDSHLRRAADRARRASPEQEPPTSINPNPRFPAPRVDYLDELDRLDTDGRLADDELLDEVNGFFRGALRFESPFCLYNIMPWPTADATAAACLSIMNNINGLMDGFAGESLLVEQKVARTLGRWAGWTGALGISCTGGKLTLQYALRSAIARAQPASAQSGLSEGLVVFCSEGAHYSLQHVAATVGIGSQNCIRIKQDDRGAMSPEALWEAMEAAHERGATIAAVVCCGGTTIDFACDDTAVIASTVDRFVDAHDLAIRPYLHLDSVIGWLYLAFADVTPEELVRRVPDHPIRARIAEVLRRFDGLATFDSLAADFHKDGLAPHSSSFFVARDPGFMTTLGTGYEYQASDFVLGNFRAYRYTFENSRPMHGVLAAWVNLRQLGRQGFGDHLVSMHRARAGLEAAVARHGAFEVLNQDSLGWEVIIDIGLHVADGETERDVAIAFIEECWERVLAGHELPLFSIVPGYRPHRDRERVAVGFLLYPVRELADDVWDAVVDSIARERDRFDTARAAAPEAVTWEKPIR
jgi:glutamate/tyrosine decarboxylase-like PLP-dependent enzyme